MTAPYYADDLVTLYLGDAREQLEWLDADVLVTDPPYGIDYTGFGGRRREPRRVTGRVAVIGDDSIVERDAALAVWGNRPALVFGRWDVPRPEQTRQRLIWDKASGPGMGDLSMPWGRGEEEIYVLGRGFRGRRESNVVSARMLAAPDPNRPNHPTPKPVGLMERLIEKCPPGTVADPFAGSGATLIAARNLGRRAIGVEIDERHCETTARRLSQQILDLGDWDGGAA